MENHNDTSEMLSDADLSAVTGGGIAAKIIRFAIGLIIGKAVVDSATEAPEPTVQQP
jgi:hypothetical protein